MFRQSDEDQMYDFNITDTTSLNLPGTSAGFKGGFGARGPGTSAGRPLMSSLGRQAPMSRAGGVPGSRMGLTTGQQDAPLDARPMTSVSGAGYKSSGNENKVFDPFNIGARGPAPPLAEKSDNSHEDKAKDMEKKVHRLMEESADAIVLKDYQRAFEKAKEAGKSERALCKFRESHNLQDQINLDLTYAICFTLANAYYYNKMYEEALNTYQLIVKNKQYPQSGRLRVNMGNIYYEQKKYPQAIKMYRMALDQIPATGKELRFRIIRNIGNAFVKLGQFQDAIENFETIMTGSPDIQTAFNLMLCLYARGDKEKMKKHFSKMLTIPIPGMTEEDQERFASGAIGRLSVSGGLGGEDRACSLRDELAKRYEDFSERILTAARFIAPVIDEKDDWVSGYRWVMEQLKTDHEMVASKLELDLAMEYMKKRKFEEAIDVLKSFEKKDPSLRAMAAANLSFIYFLEGEYSQAEKQADMAVQADRYNAKALVNKGNCLFVARDFQRAREMYLEAVGVEADCVEAIYNLGLVNLELNAPEEAKNAFDKLHTILPSAPEALFQLGMIYERVNLDEAAKTYERLISTKVPGDSNLCHRLGQVYEKLEDENTACHWQTESHRHYPVNLNVISWLGVWYVKREMYEQAIEYFEKASQVQPGEVKWRLMVTSCYRRLGDFHRALELYQKIHEDHPDNIESLQYLEALCKDMGRPYEEYTKRLEKLRRSQPQPTQQAAPTQATGSTGSGGGGGGGAQGGKVPGGGAGGPQRTERPKPERSERPGASGGDGAPTRSSRPQREEESDSRTPAPAPRAPGGRSYEREDDGRGGGGVRGGGGRKCRDDDDDDFGGTDVASLLG